ncbi:hypothetical protein ACHAW6_001318, partial [Cyclotella cf. meneghiniana]
MDLCAWECGTPSTDNLCRSSIKCTTQEMPGPTQILRSTVYTRVCVDEEHAKHLINSIEPHYKISQDWTGALYCRITLKWNYADRMEERYVGLSMPGYIKNLLMKYSHPKPKVPVHSPYPIHPWKY